MFVRTFAHSCTKEASHGVVARSKPPLLERGEYLQRAALGRPVTLGMLYDATRDETVHGGTIWKHDTLERIPRERGNNFDTKQAVETSQALDSKASVMSVQPELKLSFIGGLVAVEGSGSYLKDDRASSLQETVTFSYYAQTHWEDLKAMDHPPDQPEKASGTAGVFATHVVVGIQYGAQVRLTFQHEGVYGDTYQDVMGRLKLAVNDIPSSKISGDGKVDMDEDLRKTLERVTVKYEGDLDLGMAVSTYDDAVKAYQVIGKALTKDPSKAVPVKVFLLPLSAFKDTPSERLVRTISKDIIARATHEYQRLKDHELDLAAMAKADGCRQFSDMLTAVGSARQHLRTFMVKFQQRFQAVLPSIRMGKKEEQELLDYLEEINDSPFAENLRSEWVQHAALCIDLIYSYMRSCPGISLVANENAVRMEAAKPGAEHVVCLFLNLGPVGGALVDAMRAYLDKDASRLEEAEHRLRHEMQMRRQSSPEGMFATGRAFVSFVEANAGRDSASDIHFLVSVRNAEVADCSARWWRNGEEQQDCQLPAQVSGLEEAACGATAIIVKWARPATQGHIGFVVRYRKVQKGRAEPAFSGTSESSGTWSERDVNDTEACSFKLDNLDQESRYEIVVLSRSPLGLGCPSSSLFVKTCLPKKSEHTVLVLGETGVGKSTFINAFCNFITYNSFGDAKKLGLKAVLPSNFKQTLDGIEHTIEVGQSADDNEVFSYPGASVTQAPKCYPFKVDDGADGWKINIIDTPGIGDMRGTQQDAANIAAIVHHLTSAHDEVDAILLLLNPNLPRLTIAFKYCMLELFKSLHKDCSKNIYFVFTRSRETMYEPGDTLPNLRALLKELREQHGVDIPCNPSTYFCMDSESFRYLACCQHGLQFNTAADDDFRQSWDRSVMTVSALMRRVRSTRPFSVKSMTSLYKARTVVLRLAKPMAEIRSNLQLKKQHAERLQREISAVGDDIEGLKKMIRSPVVTKIDHPMTVCTACSSLKAGRVVYRTCHEKCVVPGVPVDTIHNVRLQRCLAMVRGFDTDAATCSCGHNWRVHQHIYYKVTEEDKMVDDEFKLAEIKAAEGALSQAQKRAAAVSLVIQELESEEKKVQACASKMAAFMRFNSICPVNDAIADHLEREIRTLETQMALEQAGPHSPHSEPDVPPESESLNARITDLRASLAQHKVERDIMLRAMKGAEIGVAVTPEDVLAMAKELQALKHSGEWIRQAMAEIDRHLESLMHMKLAQAPVYSRSKPSKWSLFGSVSEGKKSIWSFLD